ncbi:hypothetical protein K450DRAFT_246572 [Umbelopsis ramanniana AG]|uniref:Uncharacterized protein n=1 Tax=Umbelopsis ramanniana AG TaxID=1314678 RepID=A0AAD5E7Z4_UMBRA|nr:uncharacterized protein K450DRAFT_246572 [Umbelopsis ramanniana AG]KAI8578587.1 hypothetical protein K450DRAFT_246572 [Umbelopsis ramanniana AG]
MHPISLYLSVLSRRCCSMDYRPTQQICFVYTPTQVISAQITHPSCRSNKEDPLHLTHIFFFFPNRNNKFIHSRRFLTPHHFLLRYFLSAFYYTYNMRFFFSYIYILTTHIYIPLQ